MIEPDSLWSALSTARPNAGRLALLTSLPVRVQPELVRLARLRLVGGDTGDEADLWLSDLVETRSAAGFSYRRAVREYLRARLSDDTALLDDVWFRVHVERTAWLTPRARLEEELTWRLLRDRADPEIDLRWQEVIGELDASANPEGVARWIVRAVPDLPDGTLDHAAGRRAFYGASLVLGDATVLGGDPQNFLESGELAFATRRLPRRRIVVALSGNGLIVSPSADIVNGHELDIPATKPLWLQVEDLLTSPPLPSQVVTLGSETQRIAWPQTAMGLRTIDGALYGLEPETAGQTLRNRRERVDIDYDIEIYGAEKTVQLPFVVGVLSDLSGERLEPLPPLEERKMVQIDADNFDDVMRRIRPRLLLSVVNAADPDGGMLRVELSFSEIAEFLPPAVAMQVPTLRTLLMDRHSLIDLQTHVYIDPERQQLLNAALSDASNRKLWAGYTGDEFAGTAVASAILSSIDPDESRVIAAFVRGVPALCRAYKATGTSPVDVIKALDSVFPDIDGALSRQVEPILKHPSFQELEGRWRGLHQFVSRTETDAMLKIRVLNVSKAELAAAVGSTGRNAVLDRVYYDEYSQLGGEPYGLLVGDFYFDHGDENMTLLEGIARLAATAHAPFVAGVSPRLLGRSGWAGPFSIPEVDPRLESPEYDRWNRFRRSHLANYIGLALPRYLARRPYSSKFDLDAQFTFDEGVGEASEDYVWGNAAYIMARHVARSFHQSRWFARITGLEGGGSSELQSYDFPFESSSQERATEAAWTDRMESVLSRQGLMVLIASKDGSRGTFFAARSLYKVNEEQIEPGESWREVSAWNTGIGGDWRRLLPCCRFIHYIKCIVRDTVGSFSERGQLERFLQAWVAKYVSGDAPDRPSAPQALKPLAAAQLRLDASPDEPNWTVRLRVMPLYEMDIFDGAALIQGDPERAPEFTTQIPNVVRSA